MVSSCRQHSALSQLCADALFYISPDPTTQTITVSIKMNDFERLDKAGALQSVYEDYADIRSETQPGSDFSVTIPASPESCEFATYIKAVRLTRSFQCHMFSESHICDVPLLVPR